MPYSPRNLKALLDRAVATYNQPGFIPNDPINIPHRFDVLQDREIIGLWTAVLAWGQRATIIRNAEQLITLLEGEPHRFVLEHSEKDLKRFLSFVHRTFNATDALYFIHFFRRWYQQHGSLETAFLPPDYKSSTDTGPMLQHFHNTFFDDELAPVLTRKHIASPARNSSCKRLNMFLRWMVRRDDKGVDFGVWRQISPAQLVCPLDVHVQRVAMHFGLLKRQQFDWKAALELTEALRRFDPEDPVQYDFALFGLGVHQKMA